MAQQQKTPVIKKTKKSSYKPLSKLNEDNLTDLKRVEKPEYTHRVFHYNSSSRARLVSNVNVWFRDHRHTMTVLNKQQRAAMERLCRVHRDMHRAKRKGYQRKQEEIRANMRRLQTELLQRRVVQKFRRNAANKMAVRGLQSFAAMRLEAQRRLGSAGDSSSEGSRCDEKDAGQSAAFVDECEENGDNPCTDNVTGRPLSHSGPATSRLSEENRFTAEADYDATYKVGIDKESNSSSAMCPSLSESPTCTKNETVTRIVGHQTLKHSAGALKLPERTTSDSHSKPSVTLTEGNLDVIKEASVTSAGGNHDVSKEASSPRLRRQENPTLARRHRVDEKDRQHGLKHPAADFCPRANTLRLSGHPGRRRGTLSSQESVNTQVVEVKKNHPRSPFNVTRSGGTGTAANLPAISPTTSRRHPSDGDTPAVPQRSPQQDVSTSLEPSSPGPFSSFSFTLEPDRPLRTVSEPPPEVEGGGESQTVSFRSVPSLERVVGDAMAILSLQEKSPGPGHGRTRKRGSLAAHIRRERKHEASRRAKVLDREPLVQYYRSMRGHLQPLKTEPSRRSYPLPSGRHRYQQSKLLREEHEKDLTRQRHIDQFFNDLSNHGIAKPTATEDDDPAAELRDTPTTNHLELLLRKMKRRQQNLDQPVDQPAVDWNSVEQLSKCQYLRVYDWDSKDHAQASGTGEALGDDTAAEGVRLTSWTTAETRLKSEGLLPHLSHAGHI